MFDTGEQKKASKEYNINKLNEFWEEHPDGVIRFGWFP